MDLKRKVCHLTSVHPRYDTRIFLKMCSSLAKNENYQVSLIVADGLGDEIKNDVSIYDVGQKSVNRIYRMTKTVKRNFEKAKELNADVYHLHDPELIPTGIKLKKLGKKVIFDVHENIAKQIKNKEHIVKPLRYLISYIFRCYEKWTLKRFDGLLLAEDSYYEYYKDISNNCEIVLNMPDVNALAEYYSDKRDKNELFYLGGISINRGVDVIIQAMKIIKKNIPDIFLHYIGPYEKNLLDNYDLAGIENNIKFYGGIPLLEGLEFSRNTKVGLSILKPIDNYLKSYSTKIFEYMAMGLPVITSNFELYKNVIEVNKCGICVDPLNPEEIADAIEYIINNPEIATQMGKNGRKIVAEKYNWTNEEKKLFIVYKKILGE